jgi:hypothetical protein
MRDSTWDAFMDLPAASRADALDFFFALVDASPQELGIEPDHFGRYTTMLSGDSFVTFEERPDPDRHYWVYEPIPYDLPPDEEG